MTTGTWYPGRLHELSPEECWELLAAHSVGRVAFVGPDGPEVLPLNYAVARGAVLLRTSPSSALGRKLRHDVAAFQVDEIDEFTESGWSVLLRGLVEAIDVADLSPDDERPEPWAAGDRTLHLRLTPRTVTGRRLVPT